MISMMIRSQARCVALLRPSSPSQASSTAYPSLRKRSPSVMRRASSSSTSRMLSFMPQSTSFLPAFRLIAILDRRKAQRENGAHLEFAGYREPATHSISQALCNRQTQPGSMNLLRDNGRAAVKRLENSMQFGPIDALAPVVYTDPYFPVMMVLRVFASGIDRNPAPLLSVFDGIGDEVLEALRERRGIAHHQR